MNDFRGHVIDAGGGQVGILVARDTTQYPTVGAEVAIIPTAALPPCPDCGGSGWFIEAGGKEMTPCEACLDNPGTVSVARLAALWETTERAEVPE